MRIFFYLWLALLAISCKDGGSLVNPRPEFSLGWYFNQIIAKENISFAKSTNEFSFSNSGLKFNVQQSNVNFCQQDNLVKINGAEIKFDATACRIFSPTYFVNPNPFERLDDYQAITASRNVNFRLEFLTFLLPKESLRNSVYDLSQKNLTAVYSIFYPVFRQNPDGSTSAIYSTQNADEYYSVGGLLNVLSLPNGFSIRVSEIVFRNYQNNKSLIVDARQNCCS
jgi:hypothetical protein